MYTEISMLPSDIYYSQATIRVTFDSKSRHANVKIGDTLDDLCEGNITIRDIPKIRVVWKDGKYYTEDNRRLWVFKQLEKLGRCGKIRVRANDSYETMFRRDEKFTTTNGGTNVEYRGGSPGGSWYKKAQRVSDISNNRSAPVPLYQHRQNASTVYRRATTSPGPAPPPTNNRRHRDEREHRPSQNDDGFGLTGVLVTVGVAAVWLLGKAIFGR